MNYPNGVRRNKANSLRPKTKNYGNRGMTLEEDINMTNQYYLDHDMAVIHKKPTPVQIVKVNYPKRSAAKITEGYFKQASTTDYNGVYQQRYIDFEAKETNHKTLFPLANFHEHQIEHIRSTIKHGGICFIIIRFTSYDETYFFGAEQLLIYWDNQYTNGRKSIPYEDIKSIGYLIPFKYQARVDYLEIIDRFVKNGGK